MAREQLGTKHYEIEVEGPEWYCESRMRFHRYWIPRIINQSMKRYPMLRKLKRAKGARRDE